MKITLAIDEKTLARARKTVESMGKSLNQAIRDYLEELAGENNAEADIEELRQLSKKTRRNTKSWRFNREELYERT